MIYELREAKQEDFSNLPLEDLEEIFTCKIVMNFQQG